jgi:hypothetical protein
MKKSITLTFLFIFAVSAVLFPSKALAGVNYNRVMDDFVFSSSGRMTASQIDSFLNTFSSSCISTHSGFSAVDPTGYNPSHSFTYGSRVSAGKVIYDAAQAYDINPQVLLATAQKEEGLVQGDGPYGCGALAISASMGYGCPDSGTSHNYSNLSPALYYRNNAPVRSVRGTCVSTASKAGFSQQLIRAAWLLKFGQQRSLGNTSWAVIKGNWDNSDDPQTCPYGGPMTQGYRKRCSSDTSATYYDGKTTIDGTSVHMDTGATAALYWYTPHKHGNLSFYNIFVSWFGSPLANAIKVTYYDAHSSESGGTAQVGFSLAAQPTDNVSIPLALSNTSEGSLSGVTILTIAPADWNRPNRNTVTVTGLDDNIADGDIRYTLIAGKPTSNDAAYDNLTSADVPNANLTNDDNEPDVTIVGDWNGDGKTDIGLKRGSQYLLNYGKDGRAEQSIPYGRYTDEVLVGDWNGDGKKDVGLKIGNMYRLDSNHDGKADINFSFGDSSDTPLVGDWDGDHRDEIGLKRANRYYLDYNNDGHGDAVFYYGR